MFENLIISLNVVLPIFFCIALGYVLKRMKMYDTHALNVINKLCFKVFLPIYLFNNIATTNLSAAFNPKLIGFAIAAVVALFMILMMLVPRIEKQDNRRGVMIQGILRSNFALLGLPIAESLCGLENIGPTSLLVGIIVPVYNVLAVIALETYRGGKTNFVKVMKGVVTNPLIISSLIGVLFNVLKLELPQPVQKTVIDLSRVATPLALVALGGSFTLGRVKEYKKQLSIVVAGKLVLSGCLMVPLAILLGFRNEMLVPIMIMFGSPTAVSSFPMAQQMGGDGELAAEIVVFSSAMSIVTLFFWILILKQVGVI